MEYERYKTLWVHKEKWLIRHEDTQATRHIKTRQKHVRHESTYDTRDMRH